MGPDPWTFALAIAIWAVCGITAIALAVAAMRGDVGQGIYNQEDDE